MQSIDAVSSDTANRSTYRKLFQPQIPQESPESENFLCFFVCLPYYCINTHVLISLVLVTQMATVYECMNARLYKCRSTKTMWHENLFNNPELYVASEVDDHIYINYN